MIYYTISFCVLYFVLFCFFFLCFFYCFIFFFFFFSSRRRHTRSYGDWSSDVCSSDLGTLKVAAGEGRGRRRRYQSGWSSTRKTSSRSVQVNPPTRGDPLSQGSDGRESCSAGGYSAWSRHRTFMTPSPIRRHSQPQSNRAATIRVFRAGKRKSLALPRSNSTAVTVIVPPLSRLATSQRDVANHACPAGSTVS